jgi:hypothetical protein
MNFADPGVWVWQVQNCDWNRIKAISEAGFSWIAIQITSGVNPVRTGDYADLIHSARDFNLGVAGFGWLDTNPLLECEAADRLLDYWELDGFIASGEKPISYSQDGYQCPECFGYSGKWVARWKQLRPSFPLAFSSYADFSRADIHYAPGSRPVLRKCRRFTRTVLWATPPGRGERGARRRSPGTGRLRLAGRHDPPTFANYPSGSSRCPRRSGPSRGCSQTALEVLRLPGELAPAAGLGQWVDRRIGCGEAAAGDRAPHGPLLGRRVSSPGAARPSRRLKRACHRMGIASFATPDDRYNLKLEAAMHV